jgi:hypothetical protein
LIQECLLSFYASRRARGPLLVVGRDSESLGERREQKSRVCLVQVEDRQGGERGWDDSAVSVTPRNEAERLVESLVFRVTEGLHRDLNRRGAHAGQPHLERYVELRQVDHLVIEVVKLRSVEAGERRCDQCGGTKTCPKLVDALRREVASNVTPAVEAPMSVKRQFRP